MNNSSSIEPYETDEQPVARTAIDEIVLKRLAKLGIKPAPLCSDEVFLHRAFLDVIGTLPTTVEAKAFLNDKSPNKRKDLIETLLARDEFADYWTMKWDDILRVKAEFPINLWPNAAQAYHHWVHDCIKANLPYDRMAREMLTSSGSNFRTPQVNFYRAIQGRDPQAIAKSVALVFMGARAEKWPADRLKAMAALFSRMGYKPTGEWKEEIVLFDPMKALSPLKTVFPDGSSVVVPAGQDPRETFANWLIKPVNPWFSRAIVNRVWFWIFGRGIINEPDDIRADNPPVNPELLARLEKDFASSHFDLKRLYRQIFNSSTYQLSSIPTTDKPEAAVNFASYPLRRLEAEVLIDAIDQITGTTEQYSSAIPEPFTFVPENQRSIALPDGSITSSFLELFGRPARDTGLLSERNYGTTADQRLHMLNSSHIQRKIQRGPNILALINIRTTPAMIVDELYLKFLSRYPTAEEKTALTDYAVKGKLTKRDLTMDIAWALANSAEFLFRH